MWEQVTTLRQKQEYIDILTSYREYEGATISGLDNISKRNDAEIWLFRERNFTIALATNTERGTLRVINAVPFGEFSPEEAMKIVVAKAREIADAKGLTKIWGKPKKMYEDKRLNQFYQSLDQIMWEVTAIKEGDVSRLCYDVEMTRDPQRKHEDTNWTGPEIRFKREK